MTSQFDSSSIRLNRWPIHPVLFPLHCPVKFLKHCCISRDKITHVSLCSFNYLVIHLCFARLVQAETSCCFSDYSLLNVIAEIKVFFLLPQIETGHCRIKDLLTSFCIRLVFISLYGNPNSLLFNSFLFSFDCSKTVVVVTSIFSLLPFSGEETGSFSYSMFLLLRPYLMFSRDQFLFLS